MGLIVGGLDTGAAIALIVALISAASTVAYSRAQVDGARQVITKIESDVDKLRQQLAEERVEAARRYMTIEQFGVMESRLLTQFDSIRLELSELHRVLINRAESAAPRRARATGA